MAASQGSTCGASQSKTGWLKKQQYLGQQWRASGMPNVYAIIDMDVLYRTPDDYLHTLKLKRRQSTSLRKGGRSQGEAVRTCSTNLPLMVLN